MPEILPTDDRLDSWKEIAAYLKRTERTVNRWEKRGLPVYRVPGGKKQAVFAYRHELDAWLHRGGTKTDSPAQLPPEQAAFASANTVQEIELPIALNLQSSPPSRNESVSFDRSKAERLKGRSSENPPGSVLLLPTAGNTVRKKWMLGIVIACIVGVAAAVTVSLAFQRPETLRIAHLDKLTADGQAKSNLRSHGPHLYFNQFEAGREILVTASKGEEAIHTINTPFSNVDLQDISNDGQTLLVTSFEGVVEKGERPLWTLSVGGGSPHRLGEAFCDLARWSPDNRRIACVTGASILIFDENGTNPRAAGSFSSVPVRLLWSPGGDKLRIVLSDVNAGTETPWEFSVRATGSTTITAASRLPLGNNCCSGWLWTQDHKAFLYTKLNDQGRGVLFARPETGSSLQETQLLVTDVGELAAGSTDHQFYVLMGSAYRGQLFKFDARSKEFQRFLPGLSADCLSFSRDGKWMTYVSLPDKALWRSHVDGSDAVQLTKPPMDTEFSAWSPDGREIAFMGKLPGKPWRIFLVNPDGSAMRESAQGDDNQGAPTWSADGSELAYGNISCEPTHSCWIRRINLANRREELLANSNGFRTARWSPDGKYILALQPQLHQLMLFDIKTERWKVLVGGIMGDSPNWSADSRYIYVDTLKDKTPIIERARVSDGTRSTTVELTSFEKSPGQLDYWIGLAPDSTPILLHQFAPVDVYAVEWAMK